MHEEEKQPAKKRKKTVYVSLGGQPKEDKSDLPRYILYRSGYSKRKTKWFTEQIDLETLERYARMYDYVIFECGGCYMG